MFNLKNLTTGSLSAVLALASIFTGDRAEAFPLTSTRAWQGAPVFEFQHSPGFNYPGIVAMSNCSASFVMFRGASPDDKGMLLTNGHCTGGMFGGMLRPGEVYLNKARSFSVRLLNAAAQPIVTLRSELILYATMTNTDMALLQLTQTYREIQQATGVSPLLLSNAPPADNTPIEIASGYWKRTYSCSIEATVPVLREADWTFRDSVRYSPTGCEVIGGTSGSPIISTQTGEVIAINNTGNEGGEDCSMNNPCEVSPDGKTKVYNGRGYGQQTYVVYTCLNADKHLDLSVNGCVLPKPQN